MRDTWSLQRESFFDLGGELESEGVEALSEIANVLKEVVIGDEGRNGGEEASRSGDESFRDAGSDRAKAGGTSGAESGEGVDDAPNGAEQADEGSNSSGGGEPGHAFFNAANFVGGSKLHGDGNGLKRLQFRMRIVAFAGDLRLKFAIASGIHIGKGRASGDDALGIGDALGGAEDSQELVGLAADAAEDSHFLEDQRPGHEREKEKEQENGTGHKAGLLENVENVADNSGG